MFNWMRARRKCPTSVHRTIASRNAAITKLALTLTLVFSTQSLHAEQIPQTAQATQAELTADLVALELAFRGYVAIVFPVGSDHSCLVRESGVERRFRDAYRSWYEVKVDAKCPQADIERYAIWFLCSKRNGLQCSLIREPSDQNEMHQ